jgi:hypothetical protein
MQISFNVDDKFCYEVETGFKVPCPFLGILKENGAIRVKCLKHKTYLRKAFNIPRCGRCKHENGR